MSELFDPIFGGTAVGAASDDRAWLGALCEVETALARACARSSLIDLATALEIGAACADVGRGDPAELGRQSVAGGNPVIALVALVRARVAERAGPDAAAAVHLGATSQDILDTAMMLLAQRALGVILGDLNDCAEAAARLARLHRDAPMAARALLQVAVPTTFGALAAVWGAGLDRAALRLAVLRAALPVQLGGAGGTLAGLHPHGLAVLAAFADELGLAEPDGVWHSERAVIAELAGALAQAAAATAKPALDIVLLAQDEVDEVREAAPGGSSTMAHKRNPIAAITARAAAAQAPGLCATLLSGVAELQRGAGAWHAEWRTLTALLQVTGGAAARLRTSLTGLQVDTETMRLTLARFEESTLRAGGQGAGAPGSADRLGHAGDLVDRYLQRRPS